MRGYTRRPRADAGGPGGRFPGPVTLPTAAELKLQHAELRQRFTEEHPALVAIAQKLKRLDAERDALEARMRKLPNNELESARRARDVKVANEPYLAVLNAASASRTSSWARSRSTRPSARRARRT
jgi:hypothetical protein